MDFLSIPRLRDVRTKLIKHTFKKYGTRALGDIKNIAVHHSLTKTGSAESFARYHVQSNGWPGIGYHFVIEQDGTIKWCNDLIIRSYHVGNSNRRAVGVCMTGDFRSQDAEPTEAQKNSLHKLLRFLIRELRLTPADVLGHSEFPNYSWKECPCIDMYALRDRLKSNNVTAHPVMSSSKEKVIYHTSKRLDFSLLTKKMKDENHIIFSKDHKPYNLNIVGVRNPSRNVKAFDDVIACFYKYQGTWHMYAFQATTDPGEHYLENVMNTAGTAILLPGQYRGSHAIGLHKGSYKALRQVGPVTVARDRDRDSTLDIENMPKATGIFWINIHRAHREWQSNIVGKWSAGCQVIANPSDFEMFMNLCAKGSREWGNRFTYTLVEGLV